MTLKKTWMISRILSCSVKALARMTTNHLLHLPITKKKILIQ